MVKHDCGTKKENDFKSIWGCGKNCIYGYRSDCCCGDGCKFDQLNKGNSQADNYRRALYYMDERNPDLLCIYPWRRATTVLRNDVSLPCRNCKTDPVAFSNFLNGKECAVRDLCSCSECTTNPNTNDPNLKAARMGIRLYRSPVNDLPCDCRRKCKACYDDGICERCKGNNVYDAKCKDCKEYNPNANCQCC